MLVRSISHMVSSAASMNICMLPKVKFKMKAYSIFDNIGGLIYSPT